MNANDLVIMDHGHYTEHQYVAPTTKSDGQGGESDFRKGSLNLDPKLIFYCKPLNLKPTEGVPRKSPFITNWKHRIPIGERNGKPIYVFVTCGRTDHGVKGSYKHCKFCDYNGKLWKDKEDGDATAKLMYDALKSRFYGHVPVLVVGVSDAVTKQAIPNHTDLFKVRCLYLSKKNWNEDIQPRLDGDPMTSIGFQGFFGNPGRLLVVTSTKSDYGIDGKINISDKDMDIKLPVDIVEQVTELNFDKHFTVSNYDEIAKEFEKYVTNGEMKLSNVSNIVPPAPVVQGGLNAALNAGLAPAPKSVASQPIDLAPTIEVVEMQTPVVTKTVAVEVEQMSTSEAGSAAPGSLQARIAARKKEREAQGK